MFPWQQSRKSLVTDATLNFIRGDKPALIHHFTATLAISVPRLPFYDALASAADNPVLEESGQLIDTWSPNSFLQRFTPSTGVVHSCVLRFQKSSDLRWKHVRCQENLCQVSECRWKDNISREKKKTHTHTHSKNKGLGGKWDVPTHCFTAFEVPE